MNPDEEILEEDNDYYDFDDEDLGLGGDYDYWMCVICSKEFVDEEDFPNAIIDPKDVSQVRLYWLSETESVCEDCALEAGIPAIDKE